MRKSVVVAAFVGGLVSGALALEVFSVRAAAAQTPGAQPSAPPAPPQAPPRWDYYCFADDSPPSVQQKLKAAGAQGWELSTSSGTFWCMKRRL
jgi:hypothetical protein